MSTITLPREILKWLQSLDLKCSMKTPKWDISNGYLVAELCSWYFPHDVDIQIYSNAADLNTKLRNWMFLKKVFKKNDVDIDDTLIDATLHCKNNASATLLCSLYEQLTNRRVKLQNDAKPDGEEEKVPDFSDHEYQSTLPPHCRSTALQAIRNNFPASELRLQTEAGAVRRKVEKIIERHSRDRAVQRESDPERFQKQTTLGERALRRAPSPEDETSSDNDADKLTSKNNDIKGSENVFKSKAQRVSNVDHLSVEREHMEVKENEKLNSRS